MNKEEAIIKFSELKESGNSELNNYIDEATSCLENNCLKGASIMIWSTLMFFIYRKINQYGLKNFGRLCKSRGIKFQGNFNQFYDLNKIQDIDMLFLAREIGFYDINIENQLKDSLKFRNSCAHISQSIIDEAHLIPFIQNIVHYSNLINSLNYKQISRKFIDEIAQMDIDEVIKINKEMEFKTLNNILDESLRIVSLISSPEDYKKQEGIYYLICNILGNRDDDEEKVYFFKKIMDFANSKKCYYMDDILRTIAGNVHYLAIKIYLLEGNNLDGLINLFYHSSSFAIAGCMIKALSHFEDEFIDSQIISLAKAYIENNQVSGDSYTVPGILRKILKNKEECIPGDVMENLEVMGMNLD